jgi:hypothetical protein
VPTTYVINRQGQIVGQSTGMVNWQQGPLVDFLESLLGPPVHTVAQRPRNSRAPSTHVAAPLATRKPQSSGPPTRVARSPAPLPFQGFTVPKAPISEPPEAPSVKPPSTPRSRTKAREKPAVSRGRPRAVTGSSEQMLSRSSARPTRDPRSTARSAPPPMGRLSPSGGTKTLPYLPPAIPYRGEALPGYAPARPRDRRPARVQSSRPRINLDNDVSTMARVPGSPLPSDNVPPRAAPPPQGGRNLPSAMPLNRSNPIRGFVLDSFNSTRPRPVPLAPREGRRAPAQSDSSLFGQLGKIGGGVRDAVSRIMPSQ